jgi:hypothetical protein
MFSVQLQRRESDLDRISPDELVGLHPAFVLRTADSSSEDTGAGLPRRGELWRWLALAALAALVGESLWAAWIGRGRRITR